MLILYVKQIKNNAKPMPKKINILNKDRVRSPDIFPLPPALIWLTSTAFMSNFDILFMTFLH